jgi:CheY-like chemotaxis protein
MEIESTVGKGSRFSAYFPRIAPGTTESRSAPAPVAETKSLEGTETILLVDDEELVRLVARAVLSFRGYHIVEAVNGEDAVAKYSASPEKFALILMDVHMPRMNGWDAMAKIRELNPKAKIILLSGGATQDLPEDLKAKGAMAVLQKPFENIELVQLVRRVLDSDSGGKN